MLGSPAPTASGGIRRSIRYSPGGGGLQVLLNLDHPETTSDPRVGRSCLTLRPSRGSWRQRAAGSASRWRWSNSRSSRPPASEVIRLPVKSATTSLASFQIPYAFLNPFHELSRPGRTAWRRGCCPAICPPGSASAWCRGPCAGRAWRRGFGSGTPPTCSTLKLRCCSWTTIHRPTFRSSWGATPFP